MNKQYLSIGHIENCLDIVSMNIFHVSTHSLFHAPNTLVEEFPQSFQWLYSSLDFTNDFHSCYTKVLPHGKKEKPSTKHTASEAIWSGGMH